MTLVQVMLSLLLLLLLLLLSCCCTLLKQADVAGAQQKIQAVLSAYPHQAAVATSAASEAPVAAAAPQGPGAICRCSSRSTTAASSNWHS